MSVSVYASIFFTEKYVNEIGIGQVAEMTILKSRGYASIVKSIDEGKYREAKTKLEKLIQIETNELRDFKNRLENGYFICLNCGEAIERIDRYLSSIGAKTVVQ